MTALAIFGDAGAPPCSFIYDGEPSASLLARARTTERTEPVRDGALLRRRTWACPDGLLTVVLEAAEFTASPIVEWLLRFRNDGTKDAPILEDVLPLHLTLPHAGPSAPSVLHSFGCWDTGTRGSGWGTGIGNYALQSDVLQTGSSLVLSNPGGGKTVFSVPFFNLLSGTGGTSARWDGPART